MNLLIINDSGLQGGGTENRVRLLIEELLKRKTCNIQLLELEEGKSHNTKLPIKVHKCNRKNSYKKVIAIIKEFNIDLVQVHNLLGISIDPIKAAKKLKKPVIWFAHDYWPICAQRSLIRLSRVNDTEPCTKREFIKCIRCSGLISYIVELKNSYYINKVDRAIAPSIFMKNIYEKNKILKEKWMIIAPWIDTKYFYPEKNVKKEKTILFVGPLADYKGAFILAKAFKIVSKKFPEYHLKFIGYSQEQNLSKKKIENIIGESISRVCFFGKFNQTKLREEYSKATVLIFPTQCMESFGQVWAEAMACGCPVIASKIGSVPELMKDRGLLFNPKNVEELADNIIKIIRNKRPAKKLSKEGRNYVTKRFCVKKAIDSLIKLYRSI